MVHDEVTEVVKVVEGQVIGTGDVESNDAVKKDDLLVL